MEFDFSLRRSLLLAALVGAFVLLGGFSAPEVNEYYDASRVQRAWLLCMALFVGGAISVSVIEHTMGHMDPTNLRPAYVFIGVVLMGASVFWLRTLKEMVIPSAKGLLSCNLRPSEAQLWNRDQNTALWRSFQFTQATPDQARVIPHIHESVDHNTGGLLHIEETEA